MSGTGTFAIVANASAHSLRAAHARVEKASASNTLHNEARAEDFTSPGSQLACTRHASSQNDTDMRAPVWHGPRLRAAFVAQVLGQMMHDEKKTALSPAAAYHKPLCHRAAQISTGCRFSALV